MLAPLSRSSWITSAKPCLAAFNSAVQLSWQHKTYNTNKVVWFTQVKAPNTGSIITSCYRRNSSNSSHCHRTRMVQSCLPGGAIIHIQLMHAWTPHPHTHNRFTALWILSGTTRVSRYQNKHSPTHTYRGYHAWTHASPYPKQNLDQFGCFGRIINVTNTQITLHQDMLGNSLHLALLVMLAIIIAVKKLSLLSYGNNTCSKIIATACVVWFQY